MNLYFHGKNVRIDTFCCIISQRFHKFAMRKIFRIYFTDFVTCQKFCFGFKLQNKLFSDNLLLLLVSNFVFFFSKSLSKTELPKY